MVRHRSLSWTRVGVALVSLATLSTCDGNHATKPYPRPPGPSYLLADLAWDVSPDGRRVVYSHGNSEGQRAGIYALDTLAGAVPQFLMPLSESGLDPNDLRFSPDGCALAFERGVEIWVRGLADSSERQLTFTGGNAIDPDWDPSGVLIVYERPFLRYGAPDTSSGLFVLDTQTLEERHLRHDGLPTYGGDPRWSPDGQTIIFTYGSPLHVYRVNVDGSGYRDLTPGAQRDCESPEWIEGGSRIIYEAFNRTNRADHHTRAVSADGVRDVPYPIQLRPYGTRSAISRDSRFVVFDSLDISDVLVLYLKSASSPAPPTLTTPRQLTSYAPPSLTAMRTVNGGRMP